MKYEKTDICVIGAGAGGVFASIFAAGAGVKCVVVERNTTVCRKLLRTGRTRCNLTHVGSVEDFVRACGSYGRFLRHSLYEFSADDLREFFAGRGLETKVQEDGCVFPETERASDVARVLIDCAKESAVRFLFGRTVEGIEKIQDGFAVLAGGQKVLARAVIIATGGITWPFTGSTGDGYGFAKAFGHTIVEPRASLVPLITVEKWPSQLGGVAVGNVVIRGKVNNRRVSASGPMMFTTNGIGGPAVFELSRLITDFLCDDKPLKISVDLLPGCEAADMDKQIVSICKEHPKKDLPTALGKLLPKSLTVKLCELITPSQPIQAGALEKKQRKELVRMLKQLPLSIVSTCPVAEATVTRGGICIREIEPKTMESKLQPGLFFAGEVMDADGPCGGFNLQIAFSTGYLAGNMAAQRVSADTQGV